MVLINGYDETVRRGPFQLYRMHWIADGGLGFDPCDKCYKTHPIAPVESRSDGQDVPPAHFIKTVITLDFHHVR